MKSALTTYVASKNRIRRLMSRDLIVIPKANSHPVKRLEKARIIFEMLSCDLSPENLHCDGEISAAAARKKATVFNAAWRALEDIIGRHFDELELYDYSR